MFTVSIWNDIITLTQRTKRDDKHLALTADRPLQTEKTAQSLGLTLFLVENRCDLNWQGAMLLLP